MSVKAPIKENLAAKPAGQMDSHKSDQKFSFLDIAPLQLILWLARPYLAGQTAAEAIELAHKVYDENQFASTIDILGEDSHTDEDCERAVTAYRKLIDGIANNRLYVSGPLESRAQMTISIKPSMFTAVTDANNLESRQLDHAYGRIEKLVDYARVKDINVTLEAEDHRWTDFHLDTYVALVDKGYTNLGTVLQSRLFRTRNDIKRFDERMRVRMVIGIYQEPADIAHTLKPIMKTLLVEYSKELLARGTYVEAASHDEQCVRKFIKEAVIPNRASANQFETQFLLGVPRQDLEKSLINGEYFNKWMSTEPVTDAERAHLEMLAFSGALVRLYLPYGEDRLSAAYCKRRLKANPNMLIFGIKNLLRI